MIFMVERFDSRFRLPNAKIVSKRDGDVDIKDLIRSKQRRLFVYA
jgi:hypothetical protein